MKPHRHVIGALYGVTGEAILAIEDHPTFAVAKDYEVGAGGRPPEYSPNGERDQPDPPGRLPAQGRSVVRP